MSDTSLLVINDIHVTYGRAVVALTGLSLNVGEGEIVTLLGANGAGKSTTLKAVAGLLPAERGSIDHGRIGFMGHDLHRVSAAQCVRHGIVLVPEGRHCFPSLSIEENLVTGTLGRLVNRKELRIQLEEIYQIFPRLAEKRGLQAGLASGGEQQMTAIGRALMTRPKLLVLDEPSMGLAPRTVADIFRILKQLNRERAMAILVAEQNSAIALKYADRAFVIETGRVALSGPAEELRARDDIKSLYLGFDKIPPALDARAGASL